MKSFIMCASAVLGMALVGTTQVEAGHGHSNHHSTHNSHSNHYNFNSGYSRHSWRAPSHYNSLRTPSYNTNCRNSSYRFSTPRYHDTSHFDYHGPSLQRHGNHYHYIPGHYDFHRTGHWHF